VQKTPTGGACKTLCASGVFVGSGGGARFRLGFVATLANISILAARRSCPNLENRRRRGPRDFFSSLLGRRRAMCYAVAMADGARTHKRLTLREFLEWEERQPAKYELLDGLVKMMAGGSSAHNRIAGNVFAALKTALRGKPCQPWGSDQKLVAANGQSFYPDVQIDCGPFVAAATQSSEPRIVFEVLSPSTREDDFKIKLPAYQATPGIRQIVYIEPSRCHVMIWSRTPDGWVEDERVHPESAVPLDGFAFALPLSEIYDGAMGAE
jgi:Uma2 family endonuclease